MRVCRKETFLEADDTVNAPHGLRKVNPRSRKNICPSMNSDDNIVALRVVSSAIGVFEYVECDVYKYVLLFLVAEQRKLLKMNGS